MNFKKIFFSVVFLGFSLLSISSVAETVSEEELFKKGLQAYKKEDYTTALRFWKPLAEKGYASVQFNLAGMYADGKGVKADEYEAVKWYLESAKQGHEKAQLVLSIGCSEGDKVYCEGYKLYRASLLKGKY